MPNLTPQLSQLENSGLVSLAQAEPELEYLFRHGLIQDAAYSSLLKSDRKQLHQKVGECLEREYPQRLEEYAPILAHHFAEAGDAPRAERYFTLAGDVAARIYANAEAVAHYTHAIELAQNAPITAPPLPAPSPLQVLYAKKGRALELSSDYTAALANYQAMEAVAQTRGDRAMRLAALMCAATLHSTSTPLYDVERAGQLSERGLELAQALGDQAAEAKILWNRLNLYRFSGDMAQALVCGERGLSVARALGEREQLAFILNDITHVYMGNYRPHAGLASLTEATALWRALNNRPMLADNLATASLYYTMLGRFPEAITTSDEAFAISQSIQNTWGQSYSRSFVGRAFWEIGEIDRALAVMQEAIVWGHRSGFVVAQTQTRADLAALYHALGAFDIGLKLTHEATQIATTKIPVFDAYTLAVAADGYCLQGELAMAQEHVSQAEQLAEKRPHPLVTIIVGFSRVHLALAQSRFTEALTALDEALSYLGTLEFETFKTETLLLRGHALLQIGQLEAAHTTLTQARALAQTLGSRWSLWRILAALADVATRTGNPALAQTLRAEAREHLTFIIDHISAPDLRESFLNLKAVKELTG